MWNQVQIVKDRIIYHSSLVSFWDFQGASKGDYVAHGQYPYTLSEAGGPIERVEDGVFGSCVNIKEGQWLRADRSNVPALNISGPEAQVTMIAWVKRAPKSNNECEFVAGLWNESNAKRQYGMFLNLHIWDSAQQVCGHVSSIGGPTPGFRWCMDSSIGATPVPLDEWQCIGFTYDGKFAKSYLNGKMDTRPERNPYPYPGGIFDGGQDGADFTVAAVDRSGSIGNFFVGQLGGLAIFSEALSEEDMLVLGRNINGAVLEAVDLSHTKIS